jgi:outer membrane receptor for ferrienterochelin and colicin
MRLPIVTLCALVVALGTFAIPAFAGEYGAVRGSVVDQSGSPVAGATVTLRAEDEPPMTTSTDKNGLFEFPRVTFDTYTITAQTANGQIASDVLTVATDNTASVALKLSAKVIGHVAVRGRAGSEQNGVNVLAVGTISTLPGNVSLNKVMETVPGIVPFSYNEPVSRGFHGVEYEVDGVPIPQTTASNFAEIIDPRDIDRLEVFTGSIPAEFGGERDGAVVDVITSRAPEISGQRGTVSVSTGSYGYNDVTLNDVAGDGPFHVFVTANTEETNRGIDSPTYVPDHDNSGDGDEFLRMLFTPNARDSYAVDVQNQFTGFQIPIDTNTNDPQDSCWSPASTDDVQNEYDQSLSFEFNRATSDNQGYFELSPWYHEGRVAYLGDTLEDLAGGCPASTTQNRIGKYEGLTTALFRTTGKHNIKIGATGDVEHFTSQFSTTLCETGTGFPNSIPCVPTAPFLDNPSKTGTNLGVYVEDRFQASDTQSLNVGVRYDKSTGFVDGNQVSPRVEWDDRVSDKDTIHVWYGRMYAAPALEDVRRDAVIVGGLTGTPVYDLKPEHDTDFESGVAHTFSQNVTGTATVWVRDVWNVLDTTQLGSTPIFTVFNSAYGRADGLEFRMNGVTGDRGDNWFLSYGISESYANGISGGTFLFPVDQLQAANGWALEDHDQTNTLNSAYTWDYRPGDYFTFQTLWGSGFPAQFENGTGRLPQHVTFGASLGKQPPKQGSGLGWEISGTNLLNKEYLLKLNNGFNTTQYAEGRSVVVKLIWPVL